MCGTTPEPGGITMVSLRCTKAGRRTTPGDQFKLNEPLVRRLIAEGRQHGIKEALSRFWGMVSRELTQLGPAAWLPFLEWFLTVEEEQLPPPDEAQRREGPIANLHALHERVMHGFHAQQRTEPTFTVTIGRTGITVSGDLPLDEFRKVAQAIHGETDGDDTWRRYRRFIADSVVRSVEVTWKLVRYVVEKQGRWLRTGKLVDQRRLMRSSPMLLKACDASSVLIRALCRSIGTIRVGDRRLEFEELFTASDFERERVVVVLAVALKALGCKDRNLLTLKRERELRERADVVLNAGMPEYLRLPVSDTRFRKYLTLAAAQAKPITAAIVAAERAFAAEAEEFREAFRQHRWRRAAVVESLGITTARLTEQIQRHDLAETLREDRHEFIRRIYLEAVQGVRTDDDLNMMGVRAVERALRVGVAKGVEDRQYAEDVIRTAIIAADAQRLERISSDQVRDALERNRKSIRFAARALRVRERHVIELVDCYGLWDHVWGYEDLKRQRGLLY